MYNCINNFFYEPEITNNSTEAYPLIRRKSMFYILKKIHLLSLKLGKKLIDFILSLKSNIFFSKIHLDLLFSAV